MLNDLGLPTHLNGWPSSILHPQALKVQNFRSKFTEKFSDFSWKFFTLGSDFLQSTPPQSPLHLVMEKQEAVRLLTVSFRAFNFQSFQIKLSDTQRKELRNFSTVLYIPRLKISMAQKSFGYGRGGRFWNNLVDEVKDARTCSAFKGILCKRIQQ